jgi:hypothetical protein
MYILLEFRRIMQAYAYYHFCKALTFSFIVFRIYSNYVLGILVFSLSRAYFTPSLKISNISGKQPKINVRNAHVIKISGSDSRAESVASLWSQ